MINRKEANSIKYQIVLDIITGPFGQLMIFDDLASDSNDSNVVGRGAVG